MFEDTAPELLRVALYLAGDRDAAEDLLQATFVAAIEAADEYDPERPVVPWLLGILVRRASHFRQRRRRKVDPARLVARVAPPTADEVEREEIAQHCRRAIEGLPASYRQVVQLHFEHGLTYEEVARTLGRPAGTVRTQAVRGLDLLRKALPATLGGALTHPLRAGAALTRIRRAVVVHAAAGAAAPVPVLMIGGLIVNKTLVLIAGLAGASSLALALLWAATPRAAATPPGTAPTEERAAALTAALPAPATTVDTERAPVAAAAEPDLDRDATAADDDAGEPWIEGVVRGAAGEPLADATVRGRSGTVATNTDGHYRLRGHGKEEFVYATAPGHVEIRAIAQLGEPGSVARVDFDLAAAFRLVGRVIDEAGTPVADATVRTFFGRNNAVTSGPDGRFELDHLDPRRQHHLLFARKDDYVEANAQIEPQGERTAVGDLVLTRGVQVQGWVRDSSGRAVPGAEVYIGFSPSAYNRLDATANDDGSFVFPHVAPGEQTMVTTAPGLAPDRRVLQLTTAEPVHAGIEVRLEHGRFIAGVVRDDTGALRPGVSLSVRHQGEYVGNRTKTDANGRFRVEDLPSSDVELEFYGTAILRRKVAVTTLDRDDLEVVLQRAGRVAGRVVDGRTGAPLTEFTIRFVDPEPGDEPTLHGYGATWRREGHSFNTDGSWDSGNEDLQPGAAIGIEARADGFAPGQLGRMVVSLAPDPEDHVISLYPGVRLRGRLLDAHGRPIATAKIACRSAADASRPFSSEPYEAGVCTTTAAGAFDLAPVSPGSSVLLVQVPGRPVHTDGPFDIAAAGTTDRIVHLPAGANLRGRLLNAAGVPLADEEIALIAENPRFALGCKTDADGGFAFTGLPDRGYQLSHRITAGATSIHAISASARVNQGQCPPVLLQPRGSCSVVGSVRRAGGGPVPALATVSSLPQATAVPSSARRNAFARDGQFEIVGLQPGWYELRATTTTHPPLIGVAEVELTGGAQRVDLELAATSPR
ncbi:MAG: sigma-70 family RNA polymerase sigma factor [Planctomycetota bacterium]